MYCLFFVFVVNVGCTARKAVFESEIVSPVISLILRFEIVKSGSLSPVVVSLHAFLLLKILI